MIEVEIKLPVRDRRNLQKKLEEDGFVKSHLVRETDRYFNGVDRDFKKTDEAFRIRKTEWLERSALKEDSVLTDDVPCRSRRHTLHIKVQSLEMWGCPAKSWKRRWEMRR